MATEIRPPTPHEIGTLVDVLEICAGRRPGPAARSAGLRAYAPGRSLVVVDDGRIVGGGGLDPLDLTVPGPGQVPVARNLLGGVLPPYRRRGLMTQVLTQQIRSARQAGERFLVGSAPTIPFLGPVAYAPATVTTEVTVDIGHGVLREDVERAASRCRLLDDDEIRPILPGLFDRHRRRQPGQVSRESAFWELWLQDRELFRLGAGPRFAVASLADDGTPDGYLTYRLEPGPLREQPVQTLVVEDLIPCSPQAATALWAYCLGFEQARSVVAYDVAPDEPAQWWLRDPRRWRISRLRHFLWLRLLHVPAALAARGYACPGTLVLEVTDPVLPENTGTFRLVVGEEMATDCTAERGPADLALGVDALAATYLGATSFATLARAGHVRERRPGAVARADTMFRVAQSAWTVTDW